MSRLPIPLAAIVACAIIHGAPAPGAPFMKPSPLFFQAPPFDKIHDGDFLPAMEAGMKEHLREIRRISGSKAAPTFANTIVAMEKSGQTLNRVSRVFFALAQANTNPELQKVEEELAPRLAAHHDEINLDPALFKRIKTLHDRRASLGLGPEESHLLERYYQDFVHAGALLSDADKDRLRALNKEESTLATAFKTRLMAATKAGALVVDDKASLAGLSDAEIQAAAEAAKERGLPGKFVLSLQNTTQQPELASLENRAVRERLHVASARRAELGDANDTRSTLLRLAQIRAERAKIFGFHDFASYSLQDQMAHDPGAAIKLMSSLVPAATAKARAEAAKMQAFIDAEKGGFKLEAWDWQYYAEKVRKAEYDLDESRTKPYFELDRVVRDGVFYAANRLYGLTFKERKDLPVYHPDVRVFEVFDADGKPLALFYGDYFKRDNKAGGAWMDALVDQSRLLKTHPVVFNVLNIPKPAPGQKALLTFDEVTTLFHEFGHALHGMFSDVTYPLLAGAATARDFVEFPSQFNENWAMEPEVFAHYAKHVETGQPMPADLVERIRKSQTFNQGFAFTEYVAAALLDQAWHTLKPGTPVADAAAFEKEALERFGVALDQVPPRYHSTFFAHIWSGGYEASYYAYLWSEVLDHDAFAWFKANGGMTRANGDRFRRMILSRGSTRDLAPLYREFRGQDPSVEPLVEARGLNK
jgi:peptidyl-dipeptidase Dcp